MKKLFSLLLVLGVMVMMPIGAQAAGNDIELSISCEADPKCPDTEGYCYNTCKVRVTKNTVGISKIDFEAKSSDQVEVVSAEGNNGFILSSGNSKNFKLETAGDVVKTNAFDLVTYRIKFKKGVDCTQYLKFNDVEVEVPAPNDTKPPKTGATLPIAIITCGIGAAAVIYLATKKSKKLYKI